MRECRLSIRATVVRLTEINVLFGLECKRRTRSILDAIVRCECDALDGFCPAECTQTHVEPSSSFRRLFSSCFCHLRRCMCRFGLCVFYARLHRQRVQDAHEMCASTECRVPLSIRESSKQETAGLPHVRTSIQHGDVHIDGSSGAGDHNRETASSKQDREK